MTTKEYLGQISRLTRQIDNKLVELYQFRTLATSITISTGGEHIVSSPTNDKMDNTVIKIMQMEEEIDKEIDKLVNIKKKIIEKIDNMEDENHYNVLFLKFVGKKTFEWIAEDMHYSKRQVIRIYKESLIAFEQKYGKEYL